MSTHDHGLREFLARLDARGELIRIRREVDPRFEVAALIRDIQQRKNRAVVFERVKGSAHPVVSNVCGSYANVAAALGVAPSALSRTWAERLSRAAALPPTQPRGGDWKPSSLDALPICTHCEKDAGPYITAGIVAARDLDTGVTNLSYHRMQVISGRELRLRLSPTGHLFEMQQRAEHAGKSLPMAVLIGVSPIVMLASAARTAPGLTELDLAGALSGAPLSLVRCPTLDLAIPEAEVVIEGEMLPGIRRPEGPFGEWMDYYVPVMDNHVLEIRTVWARPDALYYAIHSGSAEEIVLTSLPINGDVYQAVKKWVPSVINVACWPMIQFCVIQLRKQDAGQPRRALVAAFGAELTRILFAVVVDHDVDIYDPSDVIWAMTTRCRPDKDTFVIPDVPSFARDPHQIHWGRLGIDATAPLEWPAEFERKKVPGADRIRFEDYLEDRSIR
jgi:UbiD family decarboxylase